jgi:hypothetical protein
MYGGVSDGGRVAFPKTSAAALSSVALVILFASVQFAHAAIGLSIQPVKISETLNPGQTVTGELLLKNVSDVPVVVEFSTKDFLPVAGYDSIEIVQGAQGVTSVRDWITIDSPTTFTFGINESKAIPYTITAPLDAEPGGHFGVMLFKATDQTEQGTLRVGTQVGMLVLVAVPGNRLEQGQVLDFSTSKFFQRGPVIFSIKFENTGTVHFEPRGSIVVRNMFGSEVANIPVEGQVVLPRGVKTLTEKWDTSAFLLGKYSAIATIIDGEGNEISTKEISFWAFPIWYSASFFVTLVALYLFFRFIKRRVRISIVTK